MRKVETACSANTSIRKKSVLQVDITTVIFVNLIRHCLTSLGGVVTLRGMMDLAMVTPRKRKNTPDRFRGFQYRHHYLAVFFYNGIFIYQCAGYYVRTNDRGFRRNFRVSPDLMDIACKRCRKILERRTRKRRSK